MRSTLLRSLTSLSLIAVASPLLAQEHEAAGPVNLLEPHSGLMFWTLLIFIVLLIVLARFAFKPMLAAVEAREQALYDAIEGAKADRAEAARIAEAQRIALEAARVEAQALIAQGRATAEKLRLELIEQGRLQQAEMLDRARAEIDSEKKRAIEEMRREAVDLAIAGASKVIEQNLDNTGNRRIIESFLSSIDPNRVAGAKS
jgi:F-type H+-transporting ATPase subunit b